jgi:hypothetical protein
MSVRTLSVLLCVLSAAGALTASRARAQSSDAAETADVDAGRSHFKSGVDYYRDGDLGAALIEFKRAYAAAPNYRLLYNLGQVSHELLDYTNAQTFFERYLAEGGDEIEAARRQEVQLALAKIASRIASVVVSCNVEGAELFVDDVSVGTSPLADPVRVSAGTRRIAAAVSGRSRITQVVEAAGGDTLVVKMEFPPLEPEANLAVQTNLAPKDSGPSPALWLGIGSGALGVGAGVMAYLAARDGADYRDALHRKTTVRELDSLHSQATTKALVTDILLGAALVSTVITVIVAMQDGDSEERPNAARGQPRAELTIGAGSLGLAGRFE